MKYNKLNEFEEIYKNNLLILNLFFIFLHFFAQIVSSKFSRAKYNLKDNEGNEFEKIYKNNLLILILFFFHFLSLFFFLVFFLKFSKNQTQPSWIKKNFCIFLLIFYFLPVPYFPPTHFLFIFIFLFSVYLFLFKLKHKKSKFLTFSHG